MGSTDTVLVIADASSLIALQQIGHLGLLSLLFTEIIISPSVAQEVAPTVDRLPVWCRIQAVSEKMSLRILQYALGPGESETIALSLELDPTYVILDEKAARRLAIGLGLPVVGTAGLLVKAKQSGIVPAVRPLLEELQRHSFHLSPTLWRLTLQAAGEL